jgi:hypothetical protein
MPQAGCPRRYVPDGEVVDKMQDYLDGGAQLVWCIIPKGKKITPYTSPGDAHTYKGSDTLNAYYIEPDFQVVAAALFVWTG